MSNRPGETAELLKRINFLEKQANDFERLNKVLGKVCATLQVDDLLERILEEVLQLCNADQGTVLLFGSSEQTMKTLIRQGEAEKEQLDHYLNTLLSGWVSRHKRPLLTNDLRETFGQTHVDEKYCDVLSAMSVPLRLKSEIIGVVNLISLSSAHKFSDRELNLMRLFAEQCTQFIENARLHEKLFAETVRLKREVKDRYALHGIIGQSPKMREVFELLERVIPTEGRVILQGESGTGKELVARIIHYGGPREDKPFVAVDCGALPPNLLESELFGYTKGAFTGATADKKGLFEEANSGTLFLDEIANMPVEIQVKFLRAVQEGEIRPLGSTKVKKVDVRIIAAAGENLRNRVDAGEFRQDLFYRLNVVTVALPPLRERREDIALLADSFLKKQTTNYGKKIPGFMPETIAALEAYSWPGNVRELQNVVERMVLLAARITDYLSCDLLPDEVRHHQLQRQSSPAPEEIPDLDMKTKRSQYEKQMLLRALETHGWNQSAAARELGVHEKTIRNKIKKYGLARFG